MSRAVWTLVTDGAEATRAWGAQLGAMLRAGDVVALRGELGAGKTTLVQGIVAGLGGPARVTSPTFTLVNEYAVHDRPHAGLRVIHVDAYRLGDRETADPAFDTLGLGDLLDAGDTIVLVEWAERVAALLPADRLEIALGYGAGENERRIDVHAGGPRSARLLAHLAQAEPG
jgi:tRNA threonylcarbamoyladenosine biosynthesis protein TsaE